MSFLNFVNLVPFIYIRRRDFYICKVQSVETKKRETERNSAKVRERRIAYYSVVVCSGILT